MDQGEYLKTVCSKLEQDGFELSNDRINDTDVIVGRKKKFSLLWFATQLKIFVIIGATTTVSKDFIENFSKQSLDYAIKNNKGLPRGFQTGIACFSLLVSPNVEEDAKQYVQQKPKMHFAAFEIPIIFDLANDNLYYFKKAPLWGRLYYGFFKKSIEKYFRP